MSRLSRRQVLQALFIAGASAALPLSRLRVRAQDNGSSVLVIGAGVAGLAAARTLHDEGFRVTIIEGRERVGGRVWTNRELDNVPLDMGASWIHGVEGNPLSELLAEAGAESKPTNYDNIITYDTQGQPLTDAQYAEYEALFESVIEQAIAIAEESDEDLSLGDAINEALSDVRLTAEGERAFNYFVVSVIEQEFAADVGNLSAWYWNEAGEYGGGDVVFPKGYDWLVKLLSADLDIRTGHVVTAIDYGEDGVTVTANEQLFEADYAIVTVPLGVLQQDKIAFTPALPDRKQEAIANLHMGVLNKVYLRFPDVFWDQNADFIGFIDDEKGRWAETLNIYHYTEQPILLCFNAEQFGRDLELWSDEDIVTDAMRVLRRIYGSEIPDPNGYLITRWGQDPFSFGSYSAFGIGASPEDCEALGAAVDDVLFFAGEATHPEHPATVHGALMSGYRAAEEVIEADA